MQECAAGKFHCRHPLLQPFTRSPRRRGRAASEARRGECVRGLEVDDKLVLGRRRARAKPQKMPTNASCAPWRETMTMGAKAKRRCRILLSSNSEADQSGPYARPMIVTKRAATASAAATE